MEKWLSGGSPLGLGPRRKPVRRQPVRRQMRKGMGRGQGGIYRPRPTRMQLPLTRYGKPIQLFKDSDKDGVSNVFDCSPYNKKKQDVISPANFGGGMRDMYARREGSRLTKRYNQQVQEALRLERLRLLELQRIKALPTQIVDNTQTIYRDTGANTPYIVTSSGQWVTAGSKEGKDALRELELKNSPVQKMVPVSGNATFMESLGYTGQSTGTGTVWTLAPTPAPNIFAPVTSTPFSGGGSSGGSSSKTTWSAPVTRNDGSIIQSGTTAPTIVKYVSPPQTYAPAPKVTQPRKWYNPRTWFR